MTAFEKIQRKMIDELKATEAKTPTIEKYKIALDKIDKKTRQGVKENYTKDDLVEILADIEDKDFCQAQNTKRFYYYFLRNLVTNVLNDKWPLSKKYIPDKPSGDEVSKEIFSKKTIRNKFVENGKEIDPYLRFLLAVSVIYGVRRIELCFLTEGDIDDGKIYIRTKKGGESRTHLIPEEVSDYISSEFASEREYSKATMTRKFWELEKVVGVNHKIRYGWHSIRRRLATELHVQDNDLDREEIFRFMRWSRFQDRLDEYTVRDKSEISLDQAKVDRKVFEVHPFLQRWKDEGKR